MQVSKIYPESSARQALRNQRRAQGGPGITEGKDPQPLRKIFYVDIGDMSPEKAKQYLEAVRDQMKTKDPA